MRIKTFQKEPDWVRTYEIDYSAILGTGVSIVTSNWTIPSGISGVAGVLPPTSTVITVSGGTWTHEYELINHIVASDGSESTESIVIQIRQQASYCSVRECRAMAQAMTESAVPPATDDLIEDIIERVSRLFDLAVGVPEGYFNPPLYPMATSKTFYGDGTNYLRPDPYVAGSLNSTLTFPDGYTAPDFIEKDGYLVVTLGGNIPIPGRSSILGGLPTFGWYQGVPIIISAQWGFPFTPRDVNLAVIEWIINVWRETDPAGLKLVDLNGQVLREAMPPRVNEVRKRWQMTTGLLV